jgi:hypothetical protein
MFSELLSMGTDTLIKCLFLSYFNRNWNMRASVSKTSDTKFHGKPFSHSVVIFCVQADGRTAILTFTLQGCERIKKYAY